MGGAAGEGVEGVEAAAPGFDAVSLHQLTQCRLLPSPQQAASSEQHANTCVERMPPVSPYPTPYSLPHNHTQPTLTPTPALVTKKQPETEGGREGGWEGREVGKGGERERARKGGRRTEPRGGRERER